MNVLAYNNSERDRVISKHYQLFTHSYCVGVPITSMQTTHIYDQLHVELPVTKMHEQTCFVSYALFIDTYIYYTTHSMLDFPLLADTNGYLLWQILLG